MSDISRRSWWLLGLIILLAAVLRLADVERAPMGGHGDVAWIGINALDWVDRGIWPFYIRELYAPEPLVVYLTGLLLPVTGVSYLAPRLVSTAFGLLFVVLLLPATWWLLDGAPRAVRERASLLACLGAAVSLHAMFLSRLGMESPLFPAALTLFVCLTVYAWRRGGWQRWALAGAALAFTQYIYLPARLLPIVLLLWIAHSAWAERERLRAQVRGGLVMALVAFVLALPALILFVTTPEAFSARADVGTATSGGWIWEYDLSAQGGLGSVLLQKLARILLAFGLRWDGPYTVMSQPMLGPIFFVGLLAALAACFRYPKRPAYAWPLLAILVLLITDLISGTDLEPHALHQIGVLPFVFILAGVGLAHVWDVLEARFAGGRSRLAASVALVVLAVVPGVWGTILYLTVDIPRQYADPRNGWLTEQTDVDISRRILAEPGRAYLLPYEEYSRANVAWLLSDVFRDRRSAIDGQGMLRVPALPSEFTVVMPADPYRPRHDGSPSQFDTRLWVLLVGRQALLLPPLTSIQQADIEQFIRQVKADAVVDQSGTSIATLFSGPIPPGMFTPRSVIDYPLDATFNDEIRLRGYTLADPDLTPGAVTFVTLYWQPIVRRPAEDFEVITQIWNDAGQA
ncbi:MAG TPA: hypothetical protein VJ754_07220, partial [Anaerolineae bacterium]|nr:hypothetical protein [Anaerolineae bacterium]